MTKKITWRKELLYEILIFTAGIAAISLLFKQNIILSLILIGIWLIAIKLFHTKEDIYFFIIGAILGPLAEIICIYFGAWQYANPSFLRIPLWLPLAWGFVVMLIKRVAETFIHIELKS